MRSRPAVMALLMTGALILSGCSLDDARRAARADAAVKPADISRSLRPGLVGMPDYPSSGWEPGTTKATPTPKPSAKNPLAAIGLRAADLSSSMQVAAIPDGTSLGIPTLDFCEAEYPSERLRVKRLQMGAYDASGAYAGLSTEVVVYESPKAARQALAEVIAARRACTEGKRITTYDGHKLVFTFHPAPGPSSTPLVAADSRLIVHTTMKVDDGQQTAFLVYQIDGAVLAALYATDDSGEPMSQSALDGLYGLAGDIADRLRNYTGKADSTDVTLSA